MSYIGKSVGINKFEDDGDKLMNFTINYYKNNHLHGDEEMFGIIMETWPVICSGLGNKFINYLDNVLGIVLEAAKLDIQIQDLDNYKKHIHFQHKNNMTDEAVPENPDCCATCTSIVEQKVEERFSHNHKKYVNKSVVSNKFSAIKVIQELCNELKQLFWPAISKICHVIEEACKDDLNNKIRIEGIKTIIILLNCTMESVKCNTGLFSFAKYFEITVKPLSNHLAITRFCYKKTNTNRCNRERFD